MLRYKKQQQILGSPFLPCLTLQKLSAPSRLVEKFLTPFIHLPLRWMGRLVHLDFPAGSLWERPLPKAALLYLDAKVSVFSFTL